MTTSADQVGLSISEAAEQLGLSIDTMRYYDRDGLLLRPVPRSSSGHRRYFDDDLRWITLLTRLRATGMPIREIRRYAALVRDGAGNEATRLELMYAHRRRVQDQMAEVSRHLEAIEAKIDLYESALDLERTPGDSLAS